MSYGLCPITPHRGHKLGLSESEPKFLQHLHQAVHKESSIPGVHGRTSSFLREKPPRVLKSIIAALASLRPAASRLKCALGMISSLRGVQLLIIAWWLCGASFQRAAVASDAKQKFLSYYFVFPSAHLIEVFD